MQRVCWNGCSFTEGIGFPATQRSQYCYPGILNQSLNFNGTNLAKAGSSNYTIFMRSAQAIVSNEFDIVFTQWSGLNRLWLYPGPDTEFSISDDHHHEYRYRDIYLDTKTNLGIKNLLRLMNHDYQNIIDLIDYCSILECMCKTTKTKLVYINGLVPWSDDLDKDIDCNNLAQSLSSYTKSILDFDNRNDSEILEFLIKLRSKFSILNKSLWVNLFDSFNDNIQDFGPEGHHPGINSHQWMADHLINYLNKKVL